MMSSNLKTIIAELGHPTEWNLLTRFQTLYDRKAYPEDGMQECVFFDTPVPQAPHGYADTNLQMIGCMGNVAMEIFQFQLSWGGSSSRFMDPNDLAAMIEDAWLEFRCVDRRDYMAPASILMAPIPPSFNPPFLVLPSRYFNVMMRWRHRVPAPKKHWRHDLTIMLAAHHLEYRVI